MVTQNTASTSNNDLVLEQTLITPLKWQDITPNGFEDAPNNPSSKELHFIRNIADFMIEKKQPSMEMHCAWPRKQCYASQRHFRNVPGRMVNRVSTLMDWIL